ncbi:phosphatase PAP2 family protein [Bacillus coahuilensis]|nr:phosphatase PAP2 family protein [Bacillus coahuilensis]
MGSSLFIGGTGIALILYVWWKQKNYRRVTYMVSSLAVGYYAYKGLKVVIGRDRPIGALDDGYSFPSGHSTMSFILFFLICYIVSTELKRKDIRILLYSACSLLVLFVGMSRLVHGDHYASDVLGGYLVGYIVTGTLFLFYQKWESVRSEESG